MDRAAHGEKCPPLARQILGTANKQGFIKSELLPVNMKFSVPVERRCLGLRGTEGTRDVAQWAPGESRQGVI